MSEQAQLVGAIAGLAIVALTFGLAIRRERRHLEARLAAFLGARPAEVQSLSPGTGGLVRPDTRHPILRRTRLGIQPRQIAQAGWSVTPRRFLVLQLAAGLAGLMLGRLVGARFGYQGPELVVVVVGGALAGLALPRLVWWLARRQRLGRIEKLFANALDSIANGIQAGLSLPQSLEVVSRDMPPPLGTELTLTVREMGLGLGLEEALNHLAERVPLKDVEIFVAAIHIQYRTGGNLTDLLRTLANTIRERLRIRGEVRALTAQGKLSAYIVTGLPIAIALFIRVVNPAYFERIMEPGTMRLMLYAAGCGIVAGFYVMMRIADVEV